MVNVRVHVFVSGIVQGVFFRQNTVLQAQKVGVNGWIRNLFDGRVEAVFEGDKNKVEKLVDYCRKGPADAKVEKIEVTSEFYNGEFVGFEAC
jgi:acylphosphatase